MHLVIEIRLDQYDNFLKRCDITSEAYSILNSGVISRRSKEDHFERVVEIRCRSEEAMALLHAAKRTFPAAVPEIEKMFATRYVP